VGLLLCARRAGDIDRLLHGLWAGGHEQPRRITVQQQMRVVPRYRPM